MNSLRLIPLVATLAFCPHLLLADYDPPTWEDIAAYSTAIVDATVIGQTKEGFPTLEIHSYFKGKHAATTVKGISWACKGGRLPSDLFKVDHRYVICLIRDELFEIATLYPVRRTPEGELQCQYQDAWYRQPAEWMTLEHFRKTLNEVRKRVIIQEVIDLPELRSPAWWLGNREFDISKKPFWYRGQNTQSVMEQLDDIPRPWTVPKLLAAYREAAETVRKHASDEPPTEISPEYQRCFFLMIVLAKTNDIRSVVALGESMFDEDKGISMNASSTLQFGFGIDRKWWTDNNKKLLAEIQEFTKSQTKDGKGKKVKDIR